MDSVVEPEVDLVVEPEVGSVKVAACKRDGAKPWNGGGNPG